MIFLEILYVWLSIEFIWSSYETTQSLWKANKGKQLTFLPTLEKNEIMYVADVSLRMSNNF